MSSAPASAPARTDRRKSKRLVILAFSAALLLIVVVAAYFPVSAHLRAASVLTRLAGESKGFLAHYGVNEVSVRETTFVASGTMLPARIYEPVGVANPPALVIIPGVHHLGIEEPRLKNFANAMAGHGLVVLTPSVPDIANYHVTKESIDVVGAAIEKLHSETGAPKVGVLGLSFAGSLGLLAAADPRYGKQVAFVAAIGAHDDLSRVLQFFATNHIEEPGGSRREMQAHEYGPFVVVYGHPDEFFSREDVAQATVVLRYLLWEDVDRAKVEAARLSPDGQRRMALLFDHRVDALSPVLLRGIEKYSSEMVPVSPHGKLGTLRAPVFLLHGEADNVIPPSESLWLAHDLPPGLLRECLISPVISHVELGGEPSAKDRLKLVHWMAEMLDEAQHSARPTKGTTHRAGV